MRVLPVLSLRQQRSAHGADRTPVVARSLGSTSWRSVRQNEGRLRALVEAGMAISSELSLDALLQRLVEMAAELTGARYAALGVIDRAGTQLERFVTTGIEPRRARRDRRPAARPRHPRRPDQRREAAATARPGEDPRSVGFPAEPSADAHVPRRPDHAPRRRLRQLLPDREGRRRGLHRRGPGDRRRCSRRRRRSRSRTRVCTRPRRSGRSSSSRSTRSATRSRPRPISDRLLDLIARRLRELLDARVVAVVLPGRRRRAALRRGRRRGRRRAPRPDDAARRARRAAASSSAAGASASTRCSTTRRSIRRSYAALGARTGLWVPLVARAGAIGVIAAHDKLGARRALHRRRPSARRDLRVARGGRSRPLASASRATRCAASSTRRSSSAAGSRVSCTTRPARR